MPMRTLWTARESRYGCDARARSRGRAATPSLSAPQPTRLMLKALAGKEEWSRVHGRMAAKAANACVPPPTKWHEPECTSFYPGLSAHPFHELCNAHERLTEAVELLERFYPIIKEELLALPRKSSLQQYRQPNTAVVEREMASDGVGALLHEHGDWKVHYVQLEGTDVTEHNRATPKTAKIVRSIKRNSGHSLFSVMEPGTHILPHCGPCNFRLRLHLGLVVPDNCRIRVGDQIRTWEEGKVLVLDDSFEHEVWNDSNQSRSVLIVDLWHPDFSDKEISFMEQMREASRRSLQKSTNGTESEEDRQSAPSVSHPGLVAEPEPERSSPASLGAERSRRPSEPRATGGFVAPG